jgi:N-acetylmuramoyl-L-alanine amidase
MKWDAKTGIGLIVLFSASLAVADQPANRGEPDSNSVGPLVVLDPGHGGTNAGAPAVRDGLFEKHFTLALAFEVRDQLEARGVRVVLTRETDEYLTLRERTARANELQADAFVSIHANASPNHTLSGYETYILSPDALEIDSRALRFEDGPRRADMSEDLARVLHDVERGATVPQAASLAGAIQTEMRARRGERGDRGVRQASMHVLLGATMPAVLVEVGFIDHPDEGEDILAAATRTKIAEALAEGIVSGLASADATP